MRTADPRKEEETRAEIISAAQKLFQKFGLEKTTMEDIADAAGKGKSSLYYYFPSKEEVFYAVVKREKEAVLQTIADAIKNQKSPSDKLKAFFMAHFYEVRLKFSLYSAMWEESSKHIQILRKISRENNTAEVDLIRQVLLEGIKAGEFKSIAEKDCDAVALMAITIMRGLASDIIISGKIPSEDMRAEVAVNIFVRGLR